MLLTSGVIFLFGLEFINSICLERSARHHETDCTKFYYCQNGEFNELMCNEGLEFNAQIKVCDIPERAQCTVDMASRRSVLCARGAYDCSTTTTTSCSCQTCNPSPTTPPPPTTSTCTPPATPSPPCPSDPTGPPPTVYPDCPTGPLNPCDPPVLLPVQNCSQFIICDNFGIGHLMDCAPASPRLIFDPKTQRCEWPYDTDRNNCTVYSI